jgi:hypothetical protein
MKSIHYTLVRSLVIFTLMISLSGCSKIAEYYVGLNFQPDMEENGFQQGLNVFGVLKAGPSFDTVNHYFEVQQLLPLNGSFDTMAISLADIQLKRIAANGDVQIYHPTNRNDGVYFDQSITTAPGDQWFFSCQYDTALVKSQCFVPNAPKLVGGVETTKEDSILFTIESDTTAYLYQVYLLNGNNFLTEKRVPQKGVNTSFAFKPNWTVTEGTNLVYVFAYDWNMEKYISTSNIFFKPNAYRPCFTTVEGGYGTFGAVSSAVFSDQVF